jgi:ABC-type anion transport system duplicated permease subunit
MFTRLFGMVVVLKPMMVNERFQRKKCKSSWKLVSELMTRITSRFFRMESKYMDRKMQKMSTCSSELSVSSSSKNCETSISFIPSILLKYMMEYGVR